MMRAMHEVVAGLSLEEKGFVLGAVLTGLSAAQVEAQAGARCRGALEALAGAPKTDRALMVAALVELARAAVPAGIERITRTGCDSGWRPRAARRCAWPSPSCRRRCGGSRPGCCASAARTTRCRGGRLPGAAAPGVRRAGAPGGARRAGDAAGQGAWRRWRETSWRRRSPTAAPRPSANPAGRPGEVVARAAASVGEALAAVVIAAATRDDGSPAERDEARALVARSQPPGRARGLGDWGLGGRGGPGREGHAAVLAVAQRLPLARGRRLCAAAGVEIPAG